MVKGRRWVLKHHFDGLPKADDFELVEEELPELQEGEFLFRSTTLLVIHCCQMAEFLVTYLKTGPKYVYCREKNNWP
jgi:hypothetical protein